MSIDDDFDTRTVQAAPVRLPPATGFVVRIVAGPDAGRADSACEVTASTAGSLLVGQSPSCALRLHDPSVSRRHASFELGSGNSLRIVDLGSTNGTTVNGIRVVEALLNGSERIVMGGTTLAVERLVRPAAGATNAVEQATSFGRLIGASAAMRRIYPLCRRLAASNVPVVVEGETGTGKEVLAEALHEAGPRANKPFVVFDCTAVAPSLLEAALFGHERGAFTGASESRAGVFEEADGGTLLIDEIGDLDIELQAKLLRALERGEVRRIGGRSWLRVDVRVMAATRRNLDAEVQAGRFRDDLFYRLAVARVELPPLRRRDGDVQRLALHFWNDLVPGTPAPAEFIERLTTYAWPGNVRELANAVARRVALGDLADVPEGSLTAAPHASGAAGSAHDTVSEVIGLGLPFPAARDRVLADFEARYVAHVFEKSGRSVERAAAASGIARRYFQVLRARVKRGEEP